MSIALLRYAGLSSAVARAAIPARRSFASSATTATSRVTSETARLRAEKEKLTAKLAREREKEKKERQRSKAKLEKEKERARQAREKERAKIAKEKEKEKTKVQAVKDKARLETQKVAEKKALLASIPPAPKVPPSPYTLFFKEFFTAHSKEDRFFNKETNRLSLPEIAKATGVAWNALTPAEAEKYVVASKAHRAAWEPKYAEWYDARTPEELRALGEKQGKRSRQKTVRRPTAAIARDREIKSHPEYPGRPSSAFFVFVNEIRPELTTEAESQGLSGQEKVRYIASESGKRWKAVSDADKEAYKGKVEEAKAKYEAFLEKYGFKN